MPAIWHKTAAPKMDSPFRGSLRDDSLGWAFPKTAMFISVK